MGKCCVVNKCPSGGRADRARRKRLGLRQVTLFSIPKRNDALRKWCQSLRTNLTAKDVVCEQHFPIDSVIKEDKTVLFDGNLYAIPRIRYALQDGAVPITIGNEVRQYTPSDSHMATHDYDVVKTSDEVQAYIAGYVARKVICFTKCTDCIDRLKSNDRCERDRVIDMMNRFDGLIYPSEELFKLTKTLEGAVLDVVGTLTVKENTLYQILERVSDGKNLPLVGCVEHEKQLTKRVVNFYLVMRANFLADSINKNHDANKVKSKMHRKNAKR